MEEAAAGIARLTTEDGSLPYPPVRYYELT